MLLLVLILVLVAFGVLVAALLAGSVVWAWVSVAVSGAAAAVLLIDWLQRRSAVRAASRAGAADADGDRSRRSASARPDAPAWAPPRRDVDPVTEVIPIVPPPAPPAAPRERASVAPPPWFDPVTGAQDTTVLPAVQPSGSAERPLGATDPVIPSGEESTRRVTDSRVRGRGDDDRAEPAEQASAGTGSGPDDDVERTQKVPAAGRAPGSAVAAASTTAPGTGAAGPEAEAQRDDPAAGAPATPAADAPAADHGGAPGADHPGAPTFDDPAAASSSTREPTAASAASPVADSPAREPTAAAADGTDTDAEATVKVSAVAPETRETPETQAAADDADHPPGASEARGAEAPSEAVRAADRRDTATAPAGEVPAGAAVAAETGPTDAAPEQHPINGQQAEPPEETSVPAAAAVVAELDDEVVVVDEQPRYHMAGCRSLYGRPVIPLPAREAVELGFTPCGWCTPDSILSSRHPAGAR